MNVLLGVTGGIAAYKVPDIIRGFKAKGCGARRFTYSCP